MNRYTAVFVVLLVAMTIVFGACGGTKTIKAAKNPQVQKDLKQGEAIVKGCVAKGNLLSKSGRTAIINCIAPKGHKKQFEACAQKAVSNNGFLRKKQRAKLYQGLAVCAEQNR